MAQEPDVDAKRPTFRLLQPEQATRIQWTKKLESGTGKKPLTITQTSNKKPKQLRNSRPWPEN